MSVIMLIMTNLSLTTCQNNNSSSTIKNQQRNERRFIVSFDVAPELVDAPIRSKCPQNHRQDNRGTCRLLLKGNIFVIFIFNN